MWRQQQIQLQPYSRGFHLITHEIESKLPELSEYRLGLCHLFLQHTSASLTLNENADPDVRIDMESYCRHAISENADYYRHTQEGSDDMPAHIKSSLFGADVLMPIEEGKLALGLWQGVWLGEHRNNGGRRNIIVTLQGNLYK